MIYLPPPRARVHVGNLGVELELVGVGPRPTPRVVGVVAQGDAGGVVEHRPARRSAGLQEVPRDEGVRRVEVGAVGGAAARAPARVHLPVGAHTHGTQAIMVRLSYITFAQASNKYMPRWFTHMPSSMTYAYV